MHLEGPILESLTHRLAETPEEFLSEPRIGQVGRIHVPAVVGDLLQMISSPVPSGQLSQFSGGDPRQDRNRLSIILLFCWLLSDSWFKHNRFDAQKILELISIEAGTLAAQVPARKFVADPDRREEMARLCLAGLGYRPAGETLAQAQDRLATLNSAERARVMNAARAAEERARQIREALVKKAAEEAADKWTRE